jgi:hypothetical protein
MKFLRKLENIFAAAAFAEEGEVETARELLNENEQMEEAEPVRADEKRNAYKNASPEPQH